MYFLENPLQIHLRYLVTMLNNQIHVSHLIKLLENTVWYQIPYRWHCEMVLAIRENRPVDAIRIRADHFFEGLDLIIAENLMTIAAMQLLDPSNDTLRTMDREISKEKEANDMSILTPSLDGSSPPMESPASTSCQKRLPLVLIRILRKHFENNNGHISDEDAKFYSQKYGVRVYQIENYLKNRRRRLNQKANARPATD